MPGHAKATLRAASIVKVVERAVTLRLIVGLVVVDLVVTATHESSTQVVLTVVQRTTVQPQNVKRVKGVVPAKMERKLAEKK
jgi:hypothetical protein